MHFSFRARIEVPPIRGYTPYLTHEMARNSWLFHEDMVPGGVVSVEVVGNPDFLPLGSKGPRGWWDNRVRWRLRRASVRSRGKWALPGSCEKK